MIGIAVLQQDDERQSYHKKSEPEGSLCPALCATKICPSYPFSNHSTFSADPDLV
jgi:hypothetical protein